MEVDFIMSNEAPFLNCNDYADVEELVSKKELYDRMQLQAFNKLTLTYYCPLYILPGDEYCIYFKGDSSQIERIEDENSLFLNIRADNKEFNSVYMFMPYIPDTIVALNKGFFQDLYIVGFVEDRIPTFLVDSATLVLNSNMKKLKACVNDGNFGFYEYYFLNSSEIEGVDLYLEMTDSHFFFRSYFFDSLMITVKSANSWFDFSIYSNYIKKMDIEGSIAMPFEGGRNSVISLTPTRGVLKCDTLNLKLENEKYLDVVLSDSVVINSDFTNRYGHICRSNN